MTQVESASTDANPAADDDRAPAEAPVRPGGRRGKLPRLAVWLAWLYAAGLLGLWVFLLAAADRWWLGTIAMYAPRWLYAAPLTVVLPAALLARRRAALWPLLLAVFLLLGPVMRFCLPWRTLFSSTDPGRPTLRIISVNADGDALDTAAFRKFIDEVKPDVVAFQTWESALERPLFGKSRMTGTPWSIRRHEELYVASRHPIAADEASGDPSFNALDGKLACYTIDTPAGRLRLFNLHLSTPRRGLMAFVSEGPGAADEVRQNMDRRLRQSEVASAWVGETVRAGGGAVVVVGDFNTTTDSAIYRRHWSPFANAFSVAGFGFGNTHFTRKTAIRIDHALLGPGVRCRRAWVGPDFGPGHRPLVIDVELVERSESRKKERGQDALPARAAAPLK